jgi:hypothetical protein
VELDQHVVRRLAFVRYLSQTAVAQSKAPAPLKAASLLTMHDAVELWLQLASEVCDVGASQPAFMEYWELLAPKLPPEGLSQKQSMRRLNKARVALKHQGTFPSDLDIEAFRATTVSFFQENTPLVFGLDIDEVSLLEFVNPDKSRELLKEAQALVSAGETVEALDKVAVAYAEMLEDYEDRKRKDYASPFDFGPSLTFHSSSFMKLSRRTTEERKFADFVDKVRESLDAMQGAIKTLAFGIDYRKHSRFKALTPHLVRVMSGDWHIQRRRDSEERSADDVKFCIDFVVESALALSEFDYSWSPNA